jgi:hypothetical protein
VQQPVRLRRDEAHSAPPGPSRPHQVVVPPGDHGGAQIGQEHPPVERDDVQPRRASPPRARTGHRAGRTGGAVRGVAGIPAELDIDRGGSTARPSRRLGYALPLRLPLVGVAPPQPVAVSGDATTITAALSHRRFRNSGCLEAKPDPIASCPKKVECPGPGGLPGPTGHSHGSVERLPGCRIELARSPFTSHPVVVDLIGATTTLTGLTDPHGFHGEWVCTIADTPLRPRRKRTTTK